MTGRHRAADRVVQLEAENTDLTCRLIALAHENDTLQGQLDTAGIELSGLRIDYEAAVDEIRRLQQQHIDDTARMDRLRQQLLNARPRFVEVPATAERPTAPDSVPQPHAA